MYKVDMGSLRSCVMVFSHLYVKEMEFGEKSLTESILAYPVVLS